MNAQRASFLLLVALAVSLAAMPVWGQTTTTGSSAAAPVTQGFASIPDLSGIWAHLSWPGVERPTSGPGPVTNRSRREGVSDTYQLVGDYTNPILKSEAAEIVKQHGEISLRGIPYPTPSNQCWPGGVPFVFWNLGMQMIQQPSKITILYANDYTYRQVRLNQPHPANVAPSWYGDSVGHYEGDTLVIDTVGMKVGPYSMVDWYGSPHTEALHVVERYRMVDYAGAKEGFERDAKQHNVPDGMPIANASGKYLQLRFTVEDKNVFTMPWSATMTYRYGGAAADWAELTCAENIFWYPGKEADVPQAVKPDF
jgi:hypothetical protein